MEGGLIRRAVRWEQRGSRGESRAGRTRRPDLAQPPEQQEQGESQFRNEKTAAGGLVVVDPEN